MEPGRNVRSYGFADAGGGSRLYRSLTKERVITGVKPTMRCRKDGGQC